MRKTYTIAVVLNRFDHRLPVTYFSTAIRMGTGSKWNHCVIIEYIDGVPYRVIESAMGGVKETPYLEWYALTERVVWEREILIELEQENIDAVLCLIGRAGYGILDIKELAKYIINNHWRGIDYEWDGKSGVGLFPGIFCSELCGILLGDEWCFIRFPSFYAHRFDSRLGEGKVYKTIKNQAPLFLQHA